MIESPKIRVYATALVLAVLTFLLYSRTLTFDFVNWDDDVYVYENLRLSEFSLQSLAWFFNHAYFNSYTPLTMVSHAVDGAVWGLNPAGHHLTNVLLHVWNTLWVFVLSVMVFRRITGQNAERASAERVLLPSLIAAALFAWHPLRVESVAWISDRKDLLCLFFLLPATAADFRYVDASATKDRLRWYAVLFMLFVMACLSKTVAVVLPAVLVVLDVAVVKRSFSASVLEKLPLLLVSGVFSVVAVLVSPPLDQSDMFEIFTPLQRVLLPFANVFFYLIKTLLPVGLSPIYPPHDEASSILYTSGVVATSVFTVWLLKRRTPLPLAAWLSYLILVLPTSAAAQAVMQTTADRYTYLPSVALSVAAGGLLGYVMNGAGRFARQTVMGITAVVLLTLAALSYRQQSFWANSETLWSRAAVMYPSMPLPHNNLGLALEARGDLAGAKHEYSRAIALKPDYIEAYINLGNVLFVEGNMREAESIFRRAAQLAPHRAEVFNNLGILAKTQGKTHEALQWLRRSVEVDSTYAQGYFNLAALYAAMGNTAAATEALRHAARLGYLPAREQLKQSATNH